MRGRRPETSFATAVAAFGQTLRGDALMNGYSAVQIESLAGKQTELLAAGVPQARRYGRFAQGRLTAA
ncbi:MAG: hypothetical protein CMH85_17180 [Novosphingobium sp.]|nr:hypothetical protein [Novosphingobium sp.]